MSTNCSCKDLVISELVCSVRFTPGRDLCGPFAFVLHMIPLTSEEYLNQQSTPTNQNYWTQIPKSVHFLIDEQAGTHQLVETFDRAWGITELHNPSWLGLNNCQFADHEDLFIHIGVIGSEISPAQVDAIALLMCCLNVQCTNCVNIPVSESTVIVARDLDDRLVNPWSVPVNLIPKASVCIANNGVSQYNWDDINTYGIRIADLENWREDTVDPALESLQECCDDNSAAIVVLQSDVAQLQQDVQDINVDSLVQRIEALEEGNLSILQQLQVISDCLQCANICDPVLLENVVYRLDASDAVKLVPGSIQIMNLPIKISDTNPPIVNTGPLWYAFLGEDEQTSCTLFEVEFTAQLSAATWCLGKVLEAYIIVNGLNVLVDTYTATDRSQTAIVSGSTTFNLPPDTTVQLGLRTDEDTEPLEVSMATVVIRCLNGLITPNCTDCPK